MRSRIHVGEETPMTDVQQEEDKAKMLLGAKLLVGYRISFTVFVKCVFLSAGIGIYNPC